MIRAVLNEKGAAKPLWLDVAAPSKDELAALAKDYALHPTLVADCLEPMHLPKHELHEQVTFIIVRAYDEDASPTADTVQALTRKVALFLGNRFLITIHRKALPFVERVEDKARRSVDPVYLQVALLEILAGAVDSFQKPLTDAEAQVHSFESAVLLKRGREADWAEVFRTQTRLLVIKRMLWHTQSVVQQFVPSSAMNQPIHQDVRERIESLLFFTESLLDDLRNLLNVQLALASHGTNEVVRVLALFSAFFMPMTFIVGVYGMNFRAMPELSWRYGYAGVWAVLICCALFIYAWFRRKHWL